MFKVLLLASAMAFVGLNAGSISAEETVGEKAQAKGNEVKRAMKKAGHRAAEAVCAEGDMKCAAKKAKHRAQEAGDTMKDKAQEVKEKVD